MKNIYLNKELITEINTGNWENNLLVEFGANEGTNLKIEGLHSDVLLNIDDLITICNNLKNKGVTHLEIMYDNHYDGYDVYGYIVSEKDEDEIKRKRISELQTELLVLKIEKERASETLNDFENKMKCITDELNSLNS
jgi:hypothetical protein